MQSLFALIRARARARSRARKNHETLLASLVDHSFFGHGNGHGHGHELEQRATGKKKAADSAAL